ncbi:S8 family serine peptidase [Wenzhouxiangella sp. XN201]|uniref:S8 family serine peptidase n=1 Tax=Wenzhouxiangella sp. XN201 TaxID=2710755 RepID=UPI0013CB7F09|nr:S8 family serine peptidase [Wenzhouxiangella sp. XN201]NEZ03194.1 S8 family serine peptidase [Wenzhouxiangella sp. XN201]
MLCLCLFEPAQADERWLRIDAPESGARTSLPAEAIDYGSFIWLPEQAAARARLPGRVQAFERPFDYEIDGIHFDPAGGFPAFEPEWMASRRDAAADFHLVQFRGPVKPEWLEALREIGLDPVQYRAPLSYIVWGSPTEAARARDLSFVRFGARLPPIMRVPGRDRHRPDAHTNAMALIYAAQRFETIAALEALGVTVRTVRSSGLQLDQLHLEAEPEMFAQLAAIPGILALQQIADDGGPRGEMSNQSVVGGISGDQVVPGYSEWLNGTELSGEDIIVSVVDGGILRSHVDFDSRFRDCVSTGEELTSCTSANDFHGTHVAGAIAGSGLTGIVDGEGFLRGLGMAPEARLIEQRYPDFLDGGPDGEGSMVPNGMLTIFHESALSGAVISNNSWGPAGTPRGYDIPTRHVDMITRDADPDAPGAQPILAVWAIMNGNGDRGDGECSPSSLGAPDEAKNLLSVGSTALQSSKREIFDISANSAHGPACDGRQVPQLVAPGCYTDSTTSGSDTAHGLLCGTSMAAPVVAGATALFFEQHRDQFGTLPSPALSRAVLSATARDLAGQLDANGNVLDHRPDRKQGWGRLNASRALQPESNLTLIDQIVTLTATGQSWQGSYIIHHADQPVSIRLAWTDAPGPGTGGTTPAWVNDLDLVVTANGTEYYGNDIDPTTGLSRPEGTPDGRNNLEGVVLSPDQHQGGEIVIKVLAANIAGDALDPWQPAAPRQDFALAGLNLGAPGEAVTLAFATQPADREPGQPLPAIEIESIDAAGQTAQGPEIRISLELDGCTGHCTLVGTNERETQNHRAIFSDLSIPDPGTYRLRARSANPTIDGALSDSFSIAPLFGDRFEQPPPE